MDRQGFLWYAEEATTSIGRFDPASQTFWTCLLNTAQDANADPEALTNDARGVIILRDDTRPSTSYKRMRA